MSTRKLKEKNIRSLTRVGKGSISVTIPIEMLKKLNWRERQKVVLKLKDKEIRIRDWKA